MRLFPLLLGLFSAALFTCQSSAQVFLDFSTDQLATHFREVNNPDLVSYDAVNQNVVYTIPPSSTVNRTSVAFYDTVPGTSTNEPGNFLTETVSFQTTLTAFANTSVGIFTRVQTNGAGILGLVNFTNANQVHLRLWYNATASSAGTTFYDSGVTTVANTVSLSSPITLTLTQTAADDPVFNFTVTDGEGLVLSTGDRAFTLNDSYNTPGTVGFRANMGTAGSVTVDNFSIVPEPAAPMLLGIFAVAAMASRCRRHAQHVNGR